MSETKVNGKPHPGAASPERMVEVRAARRREGFEQRKSGLSNRQVRLCHNLVLGMPKFDAYVQAGYGNLHSDPKTVSTLVSSMIRQPKMAAYMTELRESAYLENVLTLAEKRSFLADIVRTPVGTLSLEDKLAQRVRYHQGEMVEICMPDKLKAVELDAKLAGELSDTGMSLNVGIQLVNDRLASIGQHLPKDALPEK